MTGLAHTLVTEGGGAGVGWLLHELGLVVGLSVQQGGEGELGQQAEMSEGGREVFFLLFFFFSKFSSYFQIEF
jgi:hypothetical protein